MTNGSGTWVPPESTKGKVAWTRTWRLITYEPVMASHARLYLALTPESLAEGYEAVFPFLEGQGISHRHARSPEALREAEAHPVWMGKAVVIDPAGAIGADEMAAELDGEAGPHLLPVGRGRPDGPRWHGGSRCRGDHPGAIRIGTGWKYLLDK